ncbi:MAG TPA: hypothetical protein IAB90_03205 [Candidatus Coproplasma stercoripullorum]|uniref:Uncharacterized protein n=1 Tax=Candidatus Coproplasma stercoripullorum TaxID=2840751 RepID=A0A9D1AG03_9FIRM|nr:hypothetical protein [Candidatus Coproplasma stercoripullorum]
MKFFKILGIVACFAACAACLTAFNSNTCFAEGESYTFFCGDTSRDCRIITVESGAALKKLTLRDINGESTAYPELDIAEFLDEVNGQIIFTEELTDSTNYYCSANLPYSVELYGKQINLHICVKEGQTIVASPIIFGGY